MNDRERIELALRHIREPFYFVDGLTEREREAVRLASRGLNIPNVIAMKMNVTPKSVYRLLNSATEKISKWFVRDYVKFSELPDLLLKIVEGVLSDRE